MFNRVGLCGIQSRKSAVRSQLPVRARVAVSICALIQMSQQQIEQLWELQTRQSELRRHVVQLTTQLSAGERERAMLDVTVREMDAMPREAKVYKPVGKMFVLAPKEQLRGEFLELKQESTKRDTGRMSLREQFVSKLKDSEKQSEDLAKRIEAARAKTRA